MLTEPGVGPSVEAALSTSPTQAAGRAEPRKTLIGAKKAPAGKKGVIVTASSSSLPVLSVCLSV